MTSRSTTSPEDSTHADTTTGTATAQVTMTLMIGEDIPVTVTMTIMIEAAQTTSTSATTPHNNNNNNHSRDVSETDPPSGILSYGEHMNEWSTSQPGLLPAVTITTPNEEMARSHVQEHDEFSPLALSPLTNLSLSSSPPLISYSNYIIDTPEEVNYYDGGLLPELFDPLYTTAIASMTTTVPVQQPTNDTSYSSLLTDSYEPSSSPLVCEENQENETIENEQ
ncbi:hypothetical protein BDC45DRAFT_508688 [Circinella umbellata]|nr:hypothetical protein BDC45DRAFT_508688 [Circinella umbellata]